MISLFKPSCGDEEIEAVTRVLRSGWWGLGPETEAFEAEFAKFTGARYAVAVNSGTAALELAAKATGLTGGIVVVPALTFVSTGLAMQHAGNLVVFADIDEKTLCIDWTDAYEKACEFEDGNWGIVPVWYGGTVRVPPGPVREAFTVIEDCAHAAGSAFAGAFGEAAAWSFHAVKNLAAGDGGMVTTDSEDVAKELRRLRWCGIDRSTWDRDKDSRVGYGWDYDITGDGEKAHMNDLTAALGRVQLKHLSERNAGRRAIARMYNAEFDGLDWLSTPAVSDESSTHLYVVRVAAGRRDQLIQHCISNGVSAGVHYKPINTYTALFGKRHDLECGQSATPVTDRLWKTLVTLPLFPAMTNEQIQRVICVVRSFGA